MIPPEGISNIRTSMSHHVHSLPPSHRSPHLERHLLTKERERLEDEVARLERRLRQCRQRLAEIGAQLGALHDREEAGIPTSPPALGTDRASGRLAKMIVEY
jgi:hypothetical protein